MKKRQLTALAMSLILLTGACTQEAVPPRFKPTRSPAPTVLPGESDPFDEPDDDVSPPTSLSAVSSPTIGPAAPPTQTGPMQEN